LSKTPAPTPFEQRIDALIAELRAKGNKVSVSKLGLDAGFSKSTVANWIAKSQSEEGLRRTEELHKFAAHYGKTAEWLLGATDTKPPSLAPLPPQSVDDAKRWQALEELIQDEFDIAKSYEAVRDAVFHTSDGDVGWADIYRLAKRKLKLEMAPQLIQENTRRASSNPEQSESVAPPKNRRKKR
jgi:hypothetical protein